MNFIDTHTHLDGEEFLDDLPIRLPFHKVVAFNPLHGDVVVIDLAPR